MESIFNYYTKWALIALFLCSFSGAHAQTEVMAWGNLTGIRVDGQLMDFESFLTVVQKDWTFITATGKELQSPHYFRDGQTQTVTTTIDRIRFNQVVTDISKGKASVSIELQSDTTWDIEGVFFRITLPLKQYANPSLEIGSKQVTVKGDGRRLILNFDKNVEAFEKKQENPFGEFWGGFGHQPNRPTDLYIRLSGKNIQKGQKEQLSFTIDASGEIDNEPVDIEINTKNPGQEFLGFGGNFRLQNPQNDPKVIDYCLNNLRVAFGRVELPWSSWQPVENSDPLTDALAGTIPQNVDEAMKMAQRLKAIGMPVIVSAWFPPVWALDPTAPKGKPGIAAQRLLVYKQEQIYQSIADYLVALKKIYGVEAVAFSFNESDIGIDVLHTPEEHAYLIKTLGAYFAKRGLSTKLLLGDNSDATTFNFILPALNDPETHPYIYAVSFHSWRGCDDRTLNNWAWASRQLNVPLIIGEGSTDASAHRYPQIFMESTFALYEINLYTRIAAICQPQSILQWQLTSDYSLLTGNGIYGSTGALRPSQRFWNLKQLATTPEHAFSLPFTCTKEEVNPAAFGNISKGEYVVHAVNNGAARPATIKGLPLTSASEVKVYVTNNQQSMEEIRNFKLVNGTIQLDFPAISFVSVFINN